MKRVKHLLLAPLTICIIMCIMMCSTFIFAVYTVNSDDSISEDIMSIEELRPMRAGTEDQYANRHFSTLA